LVKIYVANLVKYNEGVLKGAWFTLPTPLEEIYQKVFEPYELDENGNPYGDYVILDYESPFEIHENSSLSELNEIAEKLSQLEDDQVDAVVKLLARGIVKNLKEAIKKLEDCVFHYGCKNMGDVAYHFYKDLFPMVFSSPLENYINWDEAGEDMKCNGIFIELDNGTIVEVL
jgi:Antirestriction protein (ArdA)